jgi:hypothetical protein
MLRKSPSTSSTVSAAFAHSTSESCWLDLLGAVTAENARSLNVEEEYGTADDAVVKGAESWSSSSKVTNHP